MFRRTVEERVLEFGTTGLLRLSNLVMYDRQTESWWQEFNGEAVVGDMTGKHLELLPLSIVSWKEFKTTFPNGRVLSRDTGYSRPYGSTPYTFYDAFPGPQFPDKPDDRRLSAKERIVGISVEKESLAIPYSLLEKKPIVYYTLAGQDLVVFYRRGTASALDNPIIARGRDVGSVGVFVPRLDDMKLTFHLEGDRILDDQTGSSWNLLGKAVSGALAGKELRPVVHLSGQFWFSWVAFKPNTKVYQGS